MGFSYTPEQQQVIDIRDRNILVSAAAGSGKTAVLTERIVQMVCHETRPVDIDRLLVVTFTNAAAAEMRERIQAGIEGRLLADPESEHIQRQATLLHNAQITTIDSFCLFLLRNHFHEIGLDPAFRVADEGEIKLLEQKVLEELLEERFAEGDEAFALCVETFCPEGREKVLEGHIVKLWHQACSHPWPMEWLEARRKDYPDEDETLEETSYGVYLLEHLKLLLVGWADSYRNLERLCLEPDGPYMYAPLVEGERETMESLAGLESLEDMAERIPAFTFGRLPSKKDDTVSPMKRELVKDMRAAIKEGVGEVSERFFRTPLVLAMVQSRFCHGPVKTLLDLVEDFGNRLKEEKNTRKLLDFSDMEHYALDILLKREEGRVVPSPVAMEYRQYFQEILIDEYQDSNLVQENLLWAISGEEEGRYNRFMVGDVKQSIYKFRLARPDLFLEKYDAYGSDGMFRRIDLSRNFRSRREVVETVNGIFSRIMDRTKGKIEYDDKAALYPGASYPEWPDCESELWLIQKPEKGDLDAREAEACALAGRIKELRAKARVTDKRTGELRSVEFRDIVILLRTTSGWDETFKKVLEENGIPVYISSKRGYFAASEVQELLNILRTLDNPRQDIPLFGALLSPFGGFTEEEIALVRAGHQKESLYEALTEGAATMEKVSRFLDKLARYRSCTTYLSIRELLQKIIGDHGYLEYVTALPGGGKRRANVEMLLTKASDFEKTSFFGLFYFIRYIEKLEKYDVDYGEADPVDENANVVRLMSIHKSKGLEFPIVFVAGLAKRFNMQDASQPLLVEADMGIGADYVDVKRRIRNKTLRKSVISRKLREDNLAEELRVLYVALTRPKEKLIMTGVVDKAGEKWEQARELGREKLSFHEYMNAGSLLDFVLPVAGAAGLNVRVRELGEMEGDLAREQVGFYEKRERLNRAGELADARALEALQERFGFSYPFGNLARLYTKTSVTELKMAALEEAHEGVDSLFKTQEPVPYIPAFLREQEAMAGTARGTAYHKVMELLSWDTLPEGSRGDDLRLWMKEFLQTQVKRGRIPEDYPQALSLDKLVHFVQSDLGQRMRSAAVSGRLYREQPFVYGIPAQRLSAEFPAQEKVLIQGIVDAFFIEAEGIVLVDYKTDIIGSSRELWDRYKVQLDYYSEALEHLLAQPVKERILYSFYLERPVRGEGEAG